MKIFLLYLMSFILLDAIVPRSCRTVKDPYYPDGYDSYEMIDENVRGMELYYSDIETDAPDWRITITQDSVVLNVIDTDSTLCHQVISYTPERFVEFKDSLAKCNLTHLCYEQILPYQGLIGTYLSLLDENGNAYFEGIHLECYGEYYYNYNGDIPALRKLFTGLFPGQFEENTFLEKAE